MIEYESLGNMHLDRDIIFDAVEIRHQHPLILVRGANFSDRSLEMNNCSYTESNMGICFYLSRYSLLRVVVQMGCTQVQGCTSSRICQQASLSWSPRAQVYTLHARYHVRWGRTNSAAHWSLYGNSDRRHAIGRPCPFNPGQRESPVQLRMKTISHLVHFPRLLILCCLIFLFIYNCFLV